MSTEQPFHTVSIAPNVSFKLDEQGEPTAMIRHLNSLFCTIATAKGMRDLVMLNFGHPDIILNKAAVVDAKEGVKINLLDVEFVPSSSIVLPREAAELLHAKLGDVLEKLTKTSEG